ncbi:MAG TPA: NADH-quinone oxidoreductase subunit C [Candidatus Polarisedimenticolia bacterium]|nr:NADH-quinone oxidoreductase subunit C [Candidatus Polarisedimenticolia bacterium]
MTLRETLADLGATSFTERGRTVLCRLPRASVRGAARALLGNFPLELSLMLAADRRSDRGAFEVIYLYADRRDNRFLEITVEVPPADPVVPSIATICYLASRHEREIHDQFGITPREHPDLRPLVRHGFWPEDYHPLRKDAIPPVDLRDDDRPFPFQRVEGEGIYEIPVGPVHAGIIEPGHFRFSVDGETIIDMKARLYYTHKGTEKLFEGRGPDEAIELAERISGDTSIGHALAFCQAIEALAGVEAPPRARHIRVVLLEMERLYNHVADFGSIANDTGFAVAHAHAFRIREALLRLNKRLTGHRLLRGLLVPGGVVRDLPADLAGDPGDDLSLPRELGRVGADFEAVVAIALDNSMLRDRLRGAGILTTRTALDHGVLGYVARASGIDRDVRRDHPFAAYDRLAFKVAVLDSGDVEARTLVRVEEVRQSIGLIRQALETRPAGDLRLPLPPLPRRESAFALVEGWRGAILHWVLSDDRGRLDRVKVQDPSFVNWRPLTFALLKNIVPDFPLCNKSFNLSYSGNDL